MSKLSQLLSCLIFLGSIVAAADCGQAQVLDRFFPPSRQNQQVQYSPDDPSTRGRLYTLQTGHAGAFYNCDGEECKRNSPWICWKNGPCEDFHRPLWDITQWRLDRDDIARRICDGGCCCNQTTSAASVTKPCGCSSCVANNQSSSLVQIAKSKLLSKPKFNLRPRVAKAGLLTSPTASIAESKSITPSSGLPSMVAKSTTPAKKACDCAECRAKRNSIVSHDAKPAVSTKAVAQPESINPRAPQRSASLLDRARAAQRR